MGEGSKRRRAAVICLAALTAAAVSVITGCGKDVYSVMESASTEAALESKEEVSMNAAGINRLDYTNVSVSDLSSAVFMMARDKRNYKIYKDRYLYKKVRVTGEADRVKSSSMDLTRSVARITCISRMGHLSEKAVNGATVTVYGTVTQLDRDKCILSIEHIDRNAMEIE